MMFQSLIGDFVIHVPSTNHVYRKSRDIWGTLEYEQAKWILQQSTEKMYCVEFEDKRESNCCFSSFCKLCCMPQYLYSILEILYAIALVVLFLLFLIILRLCLKLQFPYTVICQMTYYCVVSDWSYISFCCFCSWWRRFFEYFIDILNFELWRHNH